MLQCTRHFEGVFFTDNSQVYYSIDCYANKRQPVSCTDNLTLGIYMALNCYIAETTLYAFFKPKQSTSNKQ